MDLHTESYTCLLRSRDGILRCFAKGSPYADLLLSPDAGTELAPGRFVLEQEPEECCGEREKMELVFRCENSIRTTLTFYSDRIEFKAERTGGEVFLPDNFYLGRGSKLFSDRLFTPSWPDRTLPIGHYLRREEPVQLSPGLTEQSSHTLFPTSNQWEEAEDLLGRSSYHRCWKTLGGESSIESIGPQTLSLYGYSREGDLVLDLTITSGQYIRLNDRVYEMGQFGATPAAELVQKLSQALGFATF